ncbi:RagB/SusD family nutrient uptake outer membrane protein [Sphingobacterium griseoflavum]|uniref:RagB/SusD domain-containing protein n=1 Tax=Sphingobacterium griseoflavum TaxID=1474952 RepID=A0ABQ3HRV1_9SPHI|nr:RagB/SusD family nutrient uptake outer membrane protein [Sphingobacterium griseoflavum]GHE28664.1 hypothetical protein GCM10017764_08990 [Sphingobacterium griseoflavum]
MKINHIIGSLLIGSIGFVSCDRDFLQQNPQQNIVEGSDLTSESELNIYLNGMYNRYIKGHLNAWADANVAPWTLNGSPILAGDFMSDNLVARGNVNGRLDNSFQTPATGSSVGWAWQDLRAVNYFLRNYINALPAVNNDIRRLDRYVGEALFFKSMDYYKKLVLFGDVPWLTTDLNVNSEDLFRARDSRTVVVDSLMKIVDEAFEKLPIVENQPHGRVNKDMAAFLKARIALFEGSFRTYHSDLGLSSSARSLLQECVEACQFLISSGRYALYDQGDNPYYRLFTFKQNPIADNHREAILARTYDGVIVGHATQRYWSQNNNVGSRPAGGATKGMIDEYLCIDGRPIYTGGSPGSYVSNPLFLGYEGADWRELNNRDPRLKQTVNYPGEYRTIFNPNTGISDIEENGVMYPRLGYNVGQSTVTGYAIVKHFMADRTENEAVTLGRQTAIEFRYAEVLLMYAEAKAILGTITQADIDNTINLLRARAGFDFSAYPNSRLVLGNEPADPRLDDIYRQKLDYTVSPLLREIRRERRVELAVEGRRYEDLMRWKAGNLFTVPLRGIKFTEQKQALYNGTNTAKPIIAVQEVLNRDVFLDAEGFIIAYPRSPNIANGTLPWDNKRYYWPLPLDDLTLNPKLIQNDGWQGAN